jgi:hypothetical protein
MFLGSETVIAFFGPKTVIASSVSCLHFRNFIGSLHVRQKEGKAHGKKISKEVLDNFLKVQYSRVGSRPSPAPSILTNTGKIATIPIE